MTLGSAAFGALALIRPEALNGLHGEGRALGECGGSGVCGDVEAARLYAAIYAGRAVSFGLAVSVVARAAPDGRAMALFLGVVVVVQAVDVVATVANRLKGMAVGATFAAPAHATALATTL